ncbi:MAG: hypothetical protein WD042_03360 [Phycisphaeraceae bacterium]
MNRFLVLIKSNPVIGICIAVALLSVVAVSFFYWRGGSFKAEVALRGGKLNELQRSLRQRVELPPEKPDGKPREELITINDKAIEEIRRVYGEIGRQSEEISRLLMQRNARGPETLLLPALLPVPVKESLRADVKYAYRAALRDLLTQGIRAGLPPDEDRIKTRVAEVENQFLTSGVGVQTYASLSQAERRKLDALMRNKVTEMLVERARDLELYAVTDPNSADFPLDTRPLSMPANASDEQIWSGQMAYWIQRDIIAAIARANRGINAQAHVPSAPVKQLLRISVVPGSVGLTGDSGLKSGPAGAPSGNPTVEQYGPVTPPSATGEAPAPVIVADPKQALPYNFNLSPTGRVSNQLYDVHHVWVTAIVDVQRLPEFIYQLREVNFMTVLKVDIHNVDEYEAFRQGMVYGTEDAVRVEMLVETIWFRQWTAKLMAPSVQKAVGVPQPPAVAQP